MDLRKARGARVGWPALAALALAVATPTDAPAVRIGAPALEELIRRGGGMAVAHHRDQRVDTLRSARGPGSIPAGTWLVATTGSASIESPIPHGLRQALPLEIFAADAGDTRLLGLRLVVETEFARFRYLRADGKFGTVVQIGLVDTIDGANVRLGRPIGVRILGSEAVAEPTEFVLDHTGPPFTPVRLVDATARPRARLLLRTEASPSTFEVGIPFEEPARVTLAKDRLPAFGFGSAEVKIEGPDWTDSSRIRLRAGKGVVFPSTVMLRNGVATARYFTRFGGSDSVTAGGQALATRHAYLRTEWPSAFLPWAVAGGLAGGLYAANRMRRARRSGVSRYAAATVAGLILGLLGVAAYQFVPFPLHSAIPTFLFATVGGGLGPYVLERFVPPPPPGRKGPSHLRKWDVESSVPAEGE